MESEPVQADAEGDQIDSGLEGTTGSAAEELQRKTDHQINNMVKCEL